MREWRADLGRSRSAFFDLVWPAVSAACGGGELVQIEGSPHNTDRDLDTLAGIDAYQRRTDKGMRGIASRVQADPGGPWNTFTIRTRRDSGSPTEYEKRLSAVRDGGGWLYAHLTVQAYLSTDLTRLLSSAVVRTSDLFVHAESCRHGPGWSETKCGRCYVQRTSRRDDPNGNAEFLVIPWKHLLECGIQVKVWLP
jgi:hypothetical protein